MDFVKQYTWPEMSASYTMPSFKQPSWQTGRRSTDRNRGRDRRLRDDPDLNVHEHLLGGFDLEKHLEKIQSRSTCSGPWKPPGEETRAARLLGLASYQALDAQLKRLQVVYTPPEGSST